MNGTSTALIGSRTVRLAQEVADALAAPLERPMRALLVLLAYVLGVAALVGAMGVTQATTGRVVTRLTDAASTQLRVVDASTQVQPGTASDPSGAQAWALGDAAARRLAGIEGVAEVAPVRTFANVSNTVTRLRSVPGPGGGTPSDAFRGRLVVADERFFAVNQLRLASGRSDLLANSWNGQTVVAGATAAASLGMAAASSGVQVWVNGRAVDVIGVLAASGDLALDDSLYFSSATLPELADPLEAFLSVRTLDGYAEPLSRAAPFVLAPENPGQIEVSTVAQLAQLQQGINADLGSLLAVVGAVILVLSALTAGTTMFLAVQHREAEIALRRAMGASRGAIWRLFTYEGVAIGITGGILGTGAGVLLTWVVTRVNDWPLCLGPAVVWTGVGVGLLAGVVASVVPAVHAARRDPAGILRTA